MPLEQAAILVVDDEPSVIDLLHEDLSELGYNCVTTSTGEDALKKLSEGDFGVVLLDLKLPGISGMDILKEATKRYPETKVIVITAIGDMHTAVETMKNGAIDYITKPFKLERVNSSIEMALQAMTVWSSRLVPEEEVVEAVSEKTYWMDCLNHIARGVGIRLESETGSAMIITERTAAIARRIDVPQDCISRWVEARQEKIAKEMGYMSLLLSKLEANPIAQVLLGMTDSHEYKPQRYHMN